MNALIQAGAHRLEGATMYVTTKPCNWCSKVIGNTEIRRVVYPAQNGIDLVTVMV
jgi:deoxycytidylate deaminase